MRTSSSSAARDAGAVAYPELGTRVAISGTNFIETVFDRIRAGGTA
jgi:hypothetical protein